MRTAGGKVLCGRSAAQRETTCVGVKRRELALERGEVLLVCTANKLDTQDVDSSVGFGGENGGTRNFWCLGQVQPRMVLNALGA